MTLPLEAFQMLDLSRLVPGPLATGMLADLGMDVLKVEEVEVARAGRARDNFSPTVDDDGAEARALAWNHIARNKRSIALNLRSPQGREILHKLAARADVFFGSYRPDVYARLGADYETLRAINPRLIYCTLSGYGQQGSYVNWPGGEGPAQAMSGVRALTSGSDGEPATLGFYAVDNFSATLVVISIQAALLARERTGKGQNIDIAITEAGMALINQAAVGYFRYGRTPKRGAAGLGNLRCKDGRYLACAAGSETHFWDRFCDAIGRPQYKGMFPVSSDERFSGGAEARTAEVSADIRALMFTKTRDEWLRIIPPDVYVVPTLELDEALDGDYARERGVWWEVEHPLEGKVRQMGSPFRLSDTPPVFRSFAPRLGEHTEEVLQGLGYSASEIEGLAREGAIRTGRAARPLDGLPEGGLQRQAKRRYRIRG